MKKFKLINPYPNSPKLNTIVTLDELGQYVSDKIEIFQPDVIENFPEFWQEIEDKYPEIISFRKIKGDNKGILSTLHPNGFYSVTSSTDECLTLNSMLKGKYSVKDGYFEIYQVAKSKDEVFTVGDRIQHKPVHNKGEITKINLINDRIYFSTTYNKSEIGTALENAIKLETPLFITEDGVEIFKGGSAYYVDGSISIVLHANIHNKYNFFYFSSTTAAEKWIGENKPVFSKKQIRDFIEHKSWIDSKEMKEFKEKLGL